MHLDMDSFYASIEVHRRPEIAGKPVIVGADPKQGTGRGVVATCSYEARTLGIRSAMPVSRAYSLCPDAVFLRPDFPLYAEVSGEIMAVLRAQGLRFQQVSIDEAFLDASPLGSFSAAESCAREIKERVRAATGITCSVGIAPSKLVAKIASDTKKPDGLTVVEPDRVQEFLFPLPVRKVPGIGAKTEEELHRIGVMTIGDLRRYDIKALVTRFGRWGSVLHDAACGIDESTVEDREGIKSISRETTFADDTEDPEVLVHTMNALAAGVYRSLSDGGLRFRTLTVKVRYQGFVTRTKAKTFSHYVGDEKTVRDGAQEMLRSLYDGRKVRLLGLRLSNFEEHDSQQVRLFS